MKVLAGGRKISFCKICTSISHGNALKVLEMDSTQNTRAQELLLTPPDTKIMRILVNFDQIPDISCPDDQSTGSYKLQ